MTRIHYSANAGRARARLISTPTRRDHPMTAIIAGVKFSDQLAALLQHAIDHGFRAEPDTRGKRKGGVIVYPADKSHPPITISEVGAKFNRAHFDNIRREFLRAGMPPVAADVHQVDGSAVKGIVVGDMTTAEAQAAAPDGTVAVDIADLAGRLSDEKAGSDFLGEVVAALAAAGGIGEAESRLVSSVAELTFSWAQHFGSERLETARAEAVVQVTASLQKEVNEALSLASEAEARATAADRAAERAIAAEKKARDDCGAALRRAEAAEAEARRLEAAIAPLRNLLGETAAG